MLETLEIAELGARCQAILLGADTAYSARTRGQGRPYEPVVAEFERLKKLRRQDATDRIGAIVEAFNVVATELAGRIAREGDIQQFNGDLISAWCEAADLINSPLLSESAQHLFSACEAHVEASRRTFFATARAVDSSFADTRSGMAFWRNHLRSGIVRGFAINYFLDQAPMEQELIPALAEFLVGTSANFISSDPTALLRRYERKIERLTGEPGRSAALRRIFSLVPQQYHSNLRQRLSGRSWSADWLTLLDESQSIAGNAHTPAGMPAILASYLEEIEVSLEAFSSAAPHPEEICSAIELYTRTAKDLLPITKAKELEVRTHKFPRTFPKAYHEKHKEFHDFLVEAAFHYSVMGKLSDYKGVTFDELDSPISDRLKVILQATFFYSTELRKRGFWGVIPMGKQRAFGLVIQESVAKEAFENGLETVDRAYSRSPHQDKRTVEALSRLTEKYKDKLQIHGAAWSSKSTQEFLRTLIEALSKKHKEKHDEIYGEMLVRRGYVMGDLLVDMFRAGPNADLIPSVHRLLRTEDVLDESELPLFPKRPKGDIDVFPDGRRILSTALFDLGQIENIAAAVAGESGENSLRSKFHVFIIKHDIDVPVGIGFSLPFLPFLIKRDTWNGSKTESFLYTEIRKKALDIYIRDEEENRIESFLEIGIDLTGLEAEISRKDENVVDFGRARAR
jgi:hypothetical protein